MATDTVDDLQLIRAKIDHLLGIRTREGLSVPDQQRYEALILREAELLTCGRPHGGRERGASVVEYGLVASMLAITLMAVLT